MLCCILLSQSFRVFLENITTGTNNRGIKSQRTIKTKLPLQFYLNGLKIMIGQLGLV